MKGTQRNATECNGVMGTTFSDTKATEFSSIHGSWFMVHGSRVGIDGKAYGVVVSMLGVLVLVLVLVGIPFIIPIVIRVMD